MPWAKEVLANFLTENIRAVVRDEVLDPLRDRGKLFGGSRIFNNLLSSQPLCFNLFAELRFDLGSASRLVAEMTRGRFCEVTAIAFEHSPSRSDPEYSSDRSAFDVFVECRTSSGGRGFLGVEVKYHENLRVAAARHRAPYDERARQMGCFAPDAMDRLRKTPLQQIWRDHLLTGAVRARDGFDDALFVLLFPADNRHCQAAAEAYRAALTNEQSFACWHLEEVVGHLQRNEPTSRWAAKVFDRYCDFDKIERAIA